MNITNEEGNTFCRRKFFTDILNINTINSFCQLTDNEKYEVGEEKQTWSVHNK